MTGVEKPVSSGRAKAALALGKAQGRHAETSSSAGAARLKGAEANRRKADEFTAALLPVVEQIRGEGKNSCNAIAWTLNERGLRTARGGAWTGATVRALLHRAGVQIGTEQPRRR